jgi:hypothetical protein
LAGEELGAVFLEGVGDVFEEDEAEDDVLVFRRVHVVAQLVGGEPELGLEAEVAVESSVCAFAISLPFCRVTVFKGACHTMFAAF